MVADQMGVPDKFGHQRRHQKEVGIIKVINIWECKGQ